MVVGRIGELALYTSVIPRLQRAPQRLAIAAAVVGVQRKREEARSWWWPSLTTWWREPGHLTRIRPRTVAARWGRSPPDILRRQASQPRAVPRALACGTVRLRAEIETRACAAVRGRAPIRGGGGRSSCPAPADAPAGERNLITHPRAMFVPTPGLHGPAGHRPPRGRRRLRQPAFFPSSAIPPSPVRASHRTCATSSPCLEPGRRRRARFERSHRATSRPAQVCGPGRRHRRPPGRRRRSTRASPAPFPWTGTASRRSSSRACPDCT